MRFFFHFLVGEWWKSDVDAVMNQWIQTGMPPNVSDAHTINGYPGPVPNCSKSTGTDILIYMFTKAFACC